MRSRAQCPPWPPTKWRNLSDVPHLDFPAIARFRAPITAKQRWQRAGEQVRVIARERIVERRETARREAVARHKAQERERTGLAQSKARPRQVARLGPGVPEKKAWRPETPKQSASVKRFVERQAQGEAKRKARGRPDLTRARDTARFCDWLERCWIEALDCNTCVGY